MSLRLPYLAQSYTVTIIAQLALSQNHVLHSRTKHTELDIFFVHEKVLKKSLVVTYVPASDQVVDILTKRLTKAHFIPLRDKLRVLNSFQLSPQVCGGMLMY